MELNPLDPPSSSSSSLPTLIPVTPLCCCCCLFNGTFCCNGGGTGMFPFATPSVSNFTSSPSALTGTNSFSVAPLLSITLFSFNFSSTTSSGAKPRYSVSLKSLVSIMNGNFTFLQPTPSNNVRELVTDTVSSSTCSDCACCCCCCFVSLGTASMLVCITFCFACSNNAVRCSFVKISS